MKILDQFDVLDNDKYKNEINKMEKLNETKKKKEIERFIKNFNEIKKILNLNDLNLNDLNSNILNSNDLSSNDLNENDCEIKNLRNFKCDKKLLIEYIGERTDYDFIIFYGTVYYFHKNQLDSEKVIVFLKRNEG